MTRPQAVAPLSPADTETLLALRTTVLQLRDGPDDDAIRAATERQNTWLAAAHRYGYTLQALGDVVTLTRGRIRYLVRAGSTDTTGVPPVVGVTTATPTPPAVENTEGWRIRPRPTLTPEESTDLRALHQMAKGLRGNTPIGHPKRAASEKLTARLAELVSARGFTYAELATILGVKRGSIRARLKGHGYKGGPAPSQHRYGNPR